MNAMNARIAVLVGAVLLTACGAQAPQASDATRATATTSAASKDRETRVRLTAAEVDAHDRIGAVAGTSGVTGIQTSVLWGDPAKEGLYTIALHVPANTQIEAHDHPDSRIATVVSGTWYFGYGDHFDPAQLKALPPGSFYTEPPHELHFARTGSEPVVVQITGYGPTGTRYAAKAPDGAASTAPTTAAKP